MKKRIGLILIGLLMMGKVNAQIPNPDYVKALNSFIPGSPQAAQIMKYVDFPIDISTGTPEISIPIYTLNGKGISVPMYLSYHAGGGIKVNDMAGNVGLGWILNAGGEITREIRGKADDNNGFFAKPHPLSYYSSQIGGDLTNHYTEWVDVFHGYVDLEPDIFYFSFGSYSGKFVYDETINQFVCLTDKNKLKISFSPNTTPELRTWAIITDDGNKYIFANVETSQNLPGNSNNWSNKEISSWKLSKIINADETDSIIFNYTSNTYRYYTLGISTQYNIYSQNGQTMGRSPLNTYFLNEISGTSKLSSIVGSNFTIGFVDDVNPRLDMISNYQQKQLAKIIIKSNDNNIEDIFKLYYSYFNRPSYLGPTGTDLVTFGKSLKLDSISEFGNLETNSYPLTHRFGYNATVLPDRLSYAQDFWGYANSNVDGSSLVPAMWVHEYGLNKFYDGVNRNVDTSKIKAGLLEKIGLPTGGTVEYSYEPNTIGYAEPYAFCESANNVINMYSVWANINQYFGNSYDTTFTINEPPNLFVNQNNPSGGVLASISFNPLQGGLTNLDYTKPYFTLEKIGEVPNNPNSVGFSNTYQFEWGNNVYLPNGIYKIKAYKMTVLNQDLSTPRNFYFKLSYLQLNDSIFTNYDLCGVRVKSITNKDPYSNVTNKRTFKYNDPVTDSSSGMFIGNMMNHYLETLQSLNADGGRYLVRTSGNDMPGQGSFQNGVNYTKVIEENTDGTTVIRTEHIYSKGALPSFSMTWPFVPVVDFGENSRRNELLTNWVNTTPTGFVTAKSKSQEFDVSPRFLSNPSLEFVRQVYGIKCTSDSYLNGMDFGTGSTGAQLPPQYIQLYPINVNARLYLTSDSTTTYDISNANRGITQWHDYMYGDKNMQPMVIRSGNSDGSISIQKNYYASDMPDANTNINSTLASQMVAANRVTQPLGTMQYKDGQLLSQQYTYSHFEGSKLLVDSMRQALFNNPLDVEIKVLSYSPFANPLSILLRGLKYRRYIWNDALGLPLATCVSGQDSKFVFTSFEYPNELTWTETSRNTSGSFSGKYAYSLTGATAISATGFNATYGLDVYVWSTGSGITANGTTLTSTGKTKGSWTLYTTHLPNVATVTLSGNALIDQLLILPSGSQFQGNVYDGMNRVTAVVNDQILTSFYEYDNFGRLSTVKDEQGNILKATSYQYQGPQ